MSESRTGEWPVAIFDVRLSLQLEAKDFTSVDEEPLNLVASTVDALHLAAARH